MQTSTRFKSFKRIIYFLIGLVILVIAAYKIVLSNKISSSKVTQNPKAIKSTAKQKVDIGKELELEISVINDAGQILNRKGKIKFILVEAELKDEIKVKGEARKAKEGQTYLIMRIELQNETADRLAIISNKYIRLIGLEDKKFSPDFHNAMVAIDPLSVRRDLVAYIVNADAKNFTFQVGELEGEKQSIEITF